MNFIFQGLFLSSANTPFKPLFPAPNNSTQISSSGSPLLFQQTTNNSSTLNPFLQQPTSFSNLSSPLIQPSIRPPSIPSAFQPPTSAFTPLNPSNNQQTSSLIQPKLTIGNQQTPFVSLSQPVQFPIPKIPTTQGVEPTNILPPIQDFPTAQPDLQFVPPPPPPSTTMKDLNPILPPPPQQTSTGK